MDYLNGLRDILNEINIGGESDDDTNGNENFVDDDDTQAPEESSDDEGGDENFMDDSGNDSSEGEDNSNEEGNSMDNNDDSEGDDSDDEGGDENFMDDSDDSEGDDSTNEGEEQTENSDDEGGGDENFMDDSDDSGDGSTGEEGSDEGEEQTENSEDGNEESKENSDYDIEKIENELFSSLTPEQIAIKNHELKNQFIELYSIIGSTLVRINDISKSNDNINVLKFITEKLLELREMIDFNITTAYQTRTYIENNIIYQQCIATLNAIAQIIDNIPKLDGKKEVDDEEIQDKGVPVEQDKESFDSLDISDASVTNYQEESYDYSYDYNDLF